MMDKQIDKMKNWPEDCISRCKKIQFLKEIRKEIYNLASSEYPNKEAEEAAQIELENLLAEIVLKSLDLIECVIPPPIRRK